MISKEVLDIVIPTTIVLLAYPIPAAICYWEYKINHEKEEGDSGICFFPGINIILMFCCISTIWEHYFPEEVDPNYVSHNDILRQMARDLENGTAAREERKIEYAKTFIKEHNMQSDFIDYCDAMELAREFQQQAGGK